MIPWKLDSVTTAFILAKVYEEKYFPIVKTYVRMNTFPPDIDAIVNNHNSTTTVGIPPKRLANTIHVLHLFLDLLMFLLHSGRCHLMKCMCVKLKAYILIVMKNIHLIIDAKIRECYYYNGRRTIQLKMMGTMLTYWRLNIHLTALMTLLSIL